MAAKIYVSSTYEDLKDYRKKVREAIQKAAHVGVAMGAVTGWGTVAYPSS